MTAREVLHRLADELSEDDAEQWLLDAAKGGRLLSLREVAALSPAGRRDYLSLRPFMDDDEITSDWDATDAAELEALDA
jgi:hypothetical protein